MRSGIIVASGSSNRYGKDKLAERILGKSVLQHSVDTMMSVCDEVIVVCDVSQWQGKLPCGVKLTNGGSTRHLSVKQGLKLLDSSSTLVAIHDGARPFVDRQHIVKLFQEAETKGNAISTTAITNTVYSVQDNIQLLNRQNLVAAQTPQVFCTDRLLPLFQDDNDDATDEAQLYLSKYATLNFVPYNGNNTKITLQGDIPQYHVGVGYDVHKLTDGNQIVLGGVDIACNKSIVAHSDGDVLLHAIMDSLLSSIGEKDIGTHFPDTDRQYKGANSANLFSKVLEMVRNMGYNVINITAVVIAQQPKLQPYIQLMADNIAKLADISPLCVGITATTTEGLGVVGQGNAIAVNASCMVYKVS